MTSPFSLALATGTHMLSNTRCSLRTYPGSPVSSLRCFASLLQNAEPEPRSLSLGGHVGFDSLPDQLVSKSVTQGFSFNILCVGECRGLARGILKQGRGENLQVSGPPVKLCGAFLAE